MQIDFTQTVTTEHKAAQAATERALCIKDDCSARISAILDERTMLNIQGAAIAGNLSALDMEVFRCGRQWVEDTLMACRAAIISGGDPGWPEIPEGIEKLAARF